MQQAIPPPPLYVLLDSEEEERERRSKRVAAAKEKGKMQGDGDGPGWIINIVRAGSDVAAHTHKAQPDHEELPAAPRGG